MQEATSCETSCFTVVSFLMVASLAFSQSDIVPPSSNDVSRNDEPQIRQLESEILKGEMHSDPAIFEKILAEDYVVLNNGMRPGPTKAKLVEAVRNAQGRAPSNIAREEDMQVYILGGTAIVMYGKVYAVRENPSQVDPEDVSDVFVRSAGAWKLKISRASQLRKTES
jgi:hypothetical protein